MKVGVLTNLNSRRNRAGGSDLPAKGLKGSCVVRRTSDISEIRPALEEFIDMGCDCWVADGGDGTLHWMLNEGREVLKKRGMWNGGSAYPMIVPSNSGTIDFVARTVGIRGTTDQVVRSLLDGGGQDDDFETVCLDTIDVRGHVHGDPDGTWAFERTGFAIAIGGIGQKFFAKYYQRPHRNPLSIIDISARTSVGYIASLLPEKLESVFPDDVLETGRYILSGTRADVVADGRKFDYGVYQGLHVSSVEIDFGTMKLFEYARKPGQLHIVVGALPVHECAYKWPFYVVGKPIPGKQWHEFPGKSLDVVATTEQLLDPVIDGEMFFGLDRLSVRLGPQLSFPVVKRH
ncbi:MAG TPA: hypothetical protein PLB35_02390 [Myxococcota bacterium]|nr:hypothetical protein [Myxococcota bacterium]HOH76078.1 hypothetical protein [Myxococcota bacterium]HPV04304.1 hypothetical protein [Myxococcota bacterium]